MSRVCLNCENIISNDELECPYCTGKLPNKDELVKKYVNMILNISTAFDSEWSMLRKFDSYKLE